MTEEPGITKVAWVSNGNNYRAVKLDGYSTSLSLVSTLITQIEDLIVEGFNPVKILSSPSVLRGLLDDWKSFTYYYDSMHLVLQLDRRLDKTIYLLYEDMDIGLIEATEFDGLDTLP